MRPPPPPRKCTLQGVQGSTARREETPARPLRGPLPAPDPVDRASPRSCEPRKLDTKHLTYGLVIAASGLFALIAGALSSISGALHTFDALNPVNLPETARLGDWRQKVDWESPSEHFGTTSQPDNVDVERYQYFVDDHPVTASELRDYLALPWYKRMAVCSLSRHRLLTARDGGSGNQ